MKRYFSGILIYAFSAFLVQAVSHFAVNKAHYAEVTFLRPDPIFVLGVLSMLIQGAVLTHLYAFYAPRESSGLKGLKFGLITGAFFVSYEALAEPAKYLVPSVPSWMLIEAAAGLLQFSLFGIVFGTLERRRPDSNLANA